MTPDEVKEKQRRIKFCMAHKIPVSVAGLTGKYFPNALLLRFDELKGFYYSVQMVDEQCQRSIVTCSLNDAEWPDEGGGFRL